MKRIAVLLIVFLCFGCFCSCDPVKYYPYQDAEYIKTVVDSVELIYYENDLAKERLGWFDGNILPFDFSKMTIIETLPKEHNDVFLDKLSQIYTLDYVPYDSPNKECIKINYTDGTFDIICFNFAFACTYDNNGNFIKIIGNGAGIQLQEIVNTMFEAKFRY